ncbi:MAG: hypothetical protein JNN07_00805 [Verrucomicrobiales bacterium]|nr:hypothetical protein [Verrucomicrobiales bacterium]
MFDPHIRIGRFGAFEESLLNRLLNEMDGVREDATKSLTRMKAANVENSAGCT